MGRLRRSARALAAWRGCALRGAHRAARAASPAGAAARWALAGLGLAGALFVQASAAERANGRLEGHGGPVMAIAVRDAASALTGSFDNSVGLWDLRTGTPRWLEGHRAAVKAVIALPGERAASAGDDLSVIVWDLATGAPLHRLEGHRGSIAALAVTPGGDRLASAGWDGRIGLWDLAEGRLLAWLEGHEGAVNDVAFAEGGRILYSASADGTVRSWDVEAARERRIEVRHGFGVNRLVIDEAAGWLAYGAGDGGTRVVALADGAVRADLTLERRPILALALSPDGALLAVGDGEGHVMVVDTADWTIRNDFAAAAQGPVWALAFAADGARLWAGGIDDTAYAFPLEGAAEPLIARTPREFLRDPATMANGERQFRRKCAVCHTLSDNGERRAGPTFADLFGRRAGIVPGFRYSDVLADSDLVWSAETLNALFDAGPAHVVPGSNMPMQRITRAEDRRDLIEFLRNNTSQ